MPDITLADGLPVWEGAAVLFGSQGKTHRGRFYVTGWSPTGLVHAHPRYGVAPDALVLDIDHQPTFMWLVYLTAEKWEMCVTVEPGAPLEFYTYDLLIRVEVTDADDLRALWLNGPAPGQG